MEDIKIFNNYKYYPVLLNLQNKDVIIIGGGKVAARKLKTLITTGAYIKIISPEFCKDIIEIYNQYPNQIILIKRKYKYGDLQDGFLVIAATCNEKCQNEIYKEAKEKNILINTVNNLALCDFIVPSSIFLEDLIISVSTQGKTPAVSRLIRKRLESQIIPSYVLLIELAGELREYIKQNIYDEEIRHNLLKKLAEPKLIEWIERNKWDRIESWIYKFIDKEKHSQYIETLIKKIKERYKNFNKN